MKISKEEPSSSATQAIGLIAAVKELHVLTTMDLHKLLRDSKNFTIHYPTEKGLLLKVNVDKIAGYLPLHLTAVLMSTDRDEAMFRYLLRGICLLHSLCDLAPRNPKLEQNFLGNVRVLEQLVDLVFYLIIVLGGCIQEDHAVSRMHLVHSTLVACTLYLLTGFISTKWQDIVTVLLVHPKIDIFMDAAFGSVHITVRSLEITLLAYYNDLSRESNLTAEQVVYYLSQQCEASLQFLQSLCRQKLFKERLVKNKELCRKGGILFLAQSILKLQIQPSLPNRIKAAVSRIKSKILSILLNLCEAESISYLDEVASSPQSLDLAKSVALEVFDVLTTAFGRDPEHLTVDRSHQMGFVHLNAMHLTDILSDDSNFRSYVMLCLTKVLAAIISLPHGDFLSCWCSSNLLETEEDASIEYDIFAAVGWVLDNTSADVRNTTNLEFNRVPNSMPGASYAHNKTSLLVKLFANLHCFVPNICEEQEKNLFVHKVLECLQMDLSNVLPGFSFACDPKVANVSRNLRSLLCHAESLTPKFLNKEDVQLLRVFVGNLQSLFTSTGSGENRFQDRKFEQSLSWDKFSKLNINEHNQEAQSTGQLPSPLTPKEPVSLNKIGGNLKEGMSENVAFPCIDQHKTRAGSTNQGNGLNRQDQGDKGASGKTASGGAREKDKDAQNIETSGSDTSTAKGKNAIGHMYNGERSKSKEHFRRVSANENPEDEKVETLQRRKRKRNIMNEEQVTLIERAILDEPDMHRNAASLQSWADKLNFHGSEVTPSQLKNWLNNRKAKLARIRAAAEADVGTPVLDKQKGQILGSYDSPDSPRDVSHTKKDLVSRVKVVSRHNPEPPLPRLNIRSPGFGCNAGQYVVLVDVHGDQVGKGNVFQVHGMWCGKSLEESGTYVVDFIELTADKADKGWQLPYPSEAAGTTFAEAEAKFGVMRVLWDSNRVFGFLTE